MGRVKENKRGAKKLIARFVIWLLFVGVVSAGIAGFFVWDRVFRPNVETGDASSSDFYIHSGSDLQGVLDSLEKKGLIKDRRSLEWLSLRKNYHNNIRPGRYRLTGGMNNNELINMLRSGNQVPVNVVFISQRKVEDIASAVAGQIEADSAAIVNLINDSEFIESAGFNANTIPALFIPNTYEMYWNVSAMQFINRMITEYERFWNEERERKRRETGLTRVEVSTMASIISEETTKIDEMPVIAGVYINRIKRGMRLQADPTIKYAIGDFTVNRILTVHLNTESPYNTYRYAGLPPGPIAVPPVQAIDAVLNAEHHDYLYFCAKEDFSGYHRFAKTLAEHNRNARLYQNALNQRRVFR